MWSEAADAFIQERWRAGLTARTISAELRTELHLSKSRNAVIGRIHRTLGKGERSRDKGGRFPAQAAPKRPVRAGRQIKRKPRMAKYIEPPQVSASLNVPLIELKPGMCKAVTDATRFAQTCCGHPTDADGIYCAPHAALHTNPSAKRAP